MNAFLNKPSGVPSDRGSSHRRTVPLRRKLFWCLVFIAIALGNQKISGQGVGISESAAITPHSSSLLELQSTARGFLTPRMTTGQRMVILSPAQGLLVYDTDTKSFWYYDSGWKALPSSSLGWGTANQLLGMNASANGNEYKSLLGSINLTVTHAVGSITLNTIQDITTTSSPTFAGLTLTSPLTVGNGGTGLTSGISGGIPYFNSTSTMASSALLTANGVIIGGGAGTAPSTIAVGANNTVLRGTGGAPVFGKIINPDINADAVTTDKILDGTIVNADVSATAAVDATKIAAGTVDNTEYGYLNGVTSSIQTQFTNVQAELDATEGGAGLNTDGTYTANSSAHYISAATSLKDADNKLDAQLFTTTTDLASEVSRATAAEGTLTTNLANEVTRATNAETALNTAITNETSRATAAEGVLTANLASEVSRATAAEATLTANLATEVTNRTAADAAIQAELDAAEGGAGLNTDGTYTANSSANYIAAATSLKDADNKLDTQVKTNADNIATSSTNISNLQTEVNNIETGSGLNADGTYTPNSSAHYISSATDLKDADNKLDAQLFTTTTDLASEVSRATAAEGTLTTNLANEVTRATTAETALNTAITNETSRATAAEGVLTANLASEVSRATAAEATLTANLATEVTNRTAADAAIQSELDATEGGAGLNTDGTYTANSSAHYISTATSLKDADNKLDAQLFTTTTDLASEVSRATAAEGTLTTNLANEVTRATTAETALNTAITNETSRATAAEGVLTANLASEVSRATAAEATLTANLATEVTNRTAADAAIQAELDATEGGAGLNTDGTYTANSSANYIAAATSLKDADNKLDAQVKTNADNIATGAGNLAAEVTRATAAEAALNTAITNETSRATAAEGVLTANLASEVSRATAAEATLTANLATEVTNRTAADAAIQAELDATEGGAGLNTDGTYTANSSAHYISAATSLKDADNKLDAQLFTTTTDLASEVSRATAAEGTLTTNLANEVTRATTAETALNTAITNETSRATAAEGVLTANLASEVSRATAAEATLTANLATEVTNRTAADAAIQAELDAAEGGAGLNTDGTYTANSSANYIAAATSLKDADNKLDAQVKTNADNIATDAGNLAAEVTRATAAEAALNTAITNETSRATTAEGTLTTNLANEVTRATTAETALNTAITNETSRATAAEGVLTANLASEVSRATAAEATLTANLATEVTNRTAADAAIQAELDATEGGAGLNTDGTYTANGSAHYISTATSLKDADNKLDAQLFTTTTDLAAEVSRATTAEGTLTTNLANEVTRATTAETALNTSITNETSRATTAEGVLTANLASEVSRATAAEATLTANLATEVTNRTAADAAIQAELNTAETGAGLNADGTYTANGSSNYIKTATDLKDADNKLDAQVKINADNIASATIDYTNVQNEVNNIETGSGLNADGTYTPNGSAHYISSATDLKDADNKLDAQLFTTTTDLASEVSRATTAEGTLTTNLANEVTRATTAETALNTAITNEASRATTAEGTLTTNLAAEVTRATGAESTEVTNRTNADAAIQAELNTAETGAGLNADGTYSPNGSSNYIKTASDLKDADNKLDTQIKTNTDNIATGATNLAAEVTRATGAETALNTAISNEASRATTAEGTLTTNLANEVTRATTAETALNTAITNEASRATTAEGTLTTNLAAEVTRATGAESTEVTNRTNADAAIQTELNTAETGAGLNADGTYSPNGSSNYIKTASDLKDADNKLDTQIKTNTDNIATGATNLAAEVTRATGAETALNTAITNEASRATAAEGTLTTNLAAEVTRAQGAESTLTTNLTAEVTRATGAESTEVTNRTNADATIQSELNTAEAGAGLNTDGTYSPNGSSNYIKTASDLKDADNKLDAQIKTNTDNIATGATNLSAEVTRATGAETALNTAITNEASRATAAEGTLTTNLAAEVTRAQGAESTLTTNLTAEVTRATGAESTEVTNRTNADATIQAELNTAEAGAGLNTDGTYSPNGSSNYIKTASDLKDADTKLDAQIKTNTDNIATGASNLTAEVTRATTAEAALNTAITNEASRATSAEGTLTTNLAAEVTRAQGAESTLTTNLTAEVTRATGAETALNTAITNEASRATAAEGTLTTNLAAEVTRAQGAESTLTTNLTAEVTRATGAESTEVTNRTNADATIQAELNTAEAGAGLNTDGTYSPNGSSNYIKTASDLKDADTKLDAQIKTNTDNIATGASNLTAEVTRATGAETALNTAITNEASRATAAEGTLTTNLTAEVTRAQGAESTLTTNLAAEVTRAQGAESTLTTNLTAEVTRATGAESTEVTNRTNADAAIQSELNTAEAGAGLNADGTYSPNGSSNYIKTASDLKDADTKLDAQIKTNTDNIATGATNLTAEVTRATGAETALNTAITNEASRATAAEGTITTNLTAEVTRATGAESTEVTNRTNADATIQSELNTAEDGAGLNTDGTYSPNGSSNYIKTASDLKDADTKLDAQIKTNTDNIATGASNLTAEVTRATGAETALNTAITNEASRATAAEGTLTTNLSAEVTRAQGAESTLTTNLTAEVTRATGAESTEVTNRTNADATIQAELNTAEAGAGLNTDGTYSPNGSSNYIKTASDLKDADNKLDAQIKDNSDKIGLKADEDQQFYLGTTALRINRTSGAIALTGITSIDGNAATATSATTATNLASGGAGQIPYQSGANTTAFLSAGTSGQVLTSGGAGAPTWTTPTTGTVTNFSAGDLSPLFTTTEATTTTTPALSFTLSNAGAYTVFGNNTNAAAAPTYFTPVLASALYQNQGGATTNVLHGNNAGNPSWGQIVNGDIANSTIDLTTKVTGTLPTGNGGTGNAFTSFSGPATSVKTFTLPNASATILTSNAAVTVGQGGTGLTSGTQGGIPYFSSTSAMTSTAALTQYGVVIGGGTGSAPTTTAAGASNTVLHGNGSALPTFSAVNLSAGADVTGTLPIANGGTGSATQNFVDLTANQTIAGVKTFSSLPAFTPLTTGSIPFAGASGAISQNNANLFWDNTNSRLGIGTASPSYTLSVVGDVAVDATSSNTTTPRLIGINGWGAGSAARFTFGDPWNALQNAYGDRMQLVAYHTIDLSGNRQTATALGFVAGLASDASVNVIGTVAANPVLAVTGATAQSGNMQIWRTSTGTALASINSSGVFVSNVATGTAPFTVTSTTPVANLSIGGNAATATSATSFSGNLAGDVTGPQGTTVVASVGGSTAALVHSAELLANAAVSANTASTIVKRDASGNFTAGTITATLNGTATSATTATNLANGGAGQIPYQSGSGTTQMLAAGTAGQELTSTGTGAPVWTSPGSYQNTPGDPTGSASTTGVMMGLAAPITPSANRSGKVLIIISGDITNNTTNDGGQVQIRFGTGGAPANGAALTGTQAGSLVKMTNVGGVGGRRYPFTANAVVSMTPGSTYWVDLSLAAYSGGTANIYDVSISITEL